MSARTLPVIDATIQPLHPQAIWVDALYLPDQGPARAACLRSMGTIYSCASQVAAVLSKSRGAVLDQIDKTGQLDEAALLLLEADDWVTRVWTYQEIINSESTQFISEDESNVTVVGEKPLPPQNCHTQTLSEQGRPALGPADVAPVTFMTCV